jgi:NADH:ubiquinone oxidoreductase subunit E
VIDNSLQSELEEIVALFPRPQMAMLAALRHVCKLGHISDEIITKVASLCKIEEDAAREFFYAYSSLNKPAPVTLVCGGLSCFLSGAHNIFANPTDFGLAIGEFERSTCLGYCFRGPILRLANGTVVRAEKQGSSVLSELVPGSSKDSLVP